MMASMLAHTCLRTQKLAGLARRQPLIARRWCARIAPLPAVPETPPAVGAATSLGTNSRIQNSHEARPSSGKHLHLPSQSSAIQEHLRSGLARSIVELRSLSHGLSERTRINDVVERYTEFLVDLDSCSNPMLEVRDGSFAQLVERMVKEDADVVYKLLLDVWAVKQEFADSYSSIQPEMDKALHEFFAIRVGLRFHARQYLSKMRGSLLGYDGMLELECRPEDVAIDAANEVSALCFEELGQAPRIVVTDEECGTFTYEPTWLKYMLTEVLKNACRAVVEWHCSSGFDDALPAVNCTIEYSKDWVELKIRDEGGGISRKQMKSIWNFMYTTTDSLRSPWAAVEDGTPVGIGASGLGSQGSASRPAMPAKTRVLSGYGIGLKMSRLYARHFGGDLTISSEDNVGSEVCIRLSRSVKKAL